MFTVYHCVLSLIDRVLNSPHSETVEAVVVVLRIDATRIEVQVATISGRVQRRSPIVAIGATIVPRSPIAVA